MPFSGKIGQIRGWRLTAGVGSLSPWDDERLLSWGYSREISLLHLPDLSYFFDDEDDDEHDVQYLQEEGNIPSLFVGRYKPDRS